MGVNPSSYSVGTGFLPAGKRSWLGVDHPPSSIIVEYSYTSIPVWAFMAISRVSLTFTFTSTNNYSFKNAARTCNLRDSDADVRVDLCLWYFMYLHQ
jgi:hypothetical protein